MYISTLTANYDFKPSNWTILLVMALVSITNMNVSAQDNFLLTEKERVMENIIVEDVYTFVDIQDIKDEYTSATTITNEEDNNIDNSKSDIEAAPHTSRKRWVKYDGMSEEEIE